MSPGPNPQRFGLSQRAEQRMALQPRMRVAIEALERPAAELGEWLRAAYEKNEALRLEEPRSHSLPKGGATPRSDSERSTRHAAWLDATALSREADLEAQLEEQLIWLELDPQAERWVRFLVARLDDRGLLSESDEELLGAAEQIGLAGGDEALGRAIAELQRLEPKGLGGRDATEAMLLQLDPADADYPQLCQLLEQHLDELVSNKLPAISREIGLGVEEVARLAARAARLEPAPARSHTASAAPPLSPDLILRREGEAFELSVAVDATPGVRIDPEVAALSVEKALPADVRRHLTQRVEAARWVVDAVRAREETLLRVARVVFERQRGFLRDGPAALEPLSMLEVAEQLELHPSTVSRTVSGKHVQTGFGILPLRRFFQHAACESTSAAGSADSLLGAVRSLIEGEDKRAPLSDDQIAAALRESGFETKRRTVAKYRTQLGVPSSYRRRDFSAGAGDSVES